jgi:type II secretory pathway pseudopilin PulG
MRRLTAARRKGQPSGSDGGMTMIEVIVGMGVMVIFMSMFTSAVVMMYGSVNKSESLTNTASQLNAAFNRLDKTVRYAAAVRTPGQGTSNDWYVELLTTNTGTPVCTQLRVSQASNQLQQRTWTVAGTAPATTATNVSAWAPLASNIVNGNAAPTDNQNRPFTITTASGGLNYERLTVILRATSGAGTSAASTLSSLTFTALNTSLASATDGFCTEMARST